MAEGASYEGRDSDGNETFRVSIPTDEHGYFGRQCPSCEQLFRIHSADYEALPDDLKLTCTYCGHVDDHSDFMTQQQRERAMRAAQDFAMQLIGQALDSSFGSLARSTRSNRFVKFTYRSKPFYPEPLPDIDEERLVRERVCPKCETRYAVFGEHRFCPVSGQLSARDIAADALAAETAKLDTLGDISEAQRAVLREQGVFDRLYVDTIGHVVGIVEAVASATFSARVTDAGVLLKGKGNIFQRLDDLADMFFEHLGINVREAEGVEWPTLLRLWAGRHVHMHADGLVDERYLRSVPDSPLKVGQRVVVTEVDARTAIRLASSLCEAIA